MTDQPTVHVLHLSGYDVFAIPDNVGRDAERIFGHQHYEPLAVNVYPAALPHADLVLNDLRVVYGEELNFTPRAMAWLEHLKELRDSVEAENVPDDVDFVYPPYLHQRRGLARALAYSRYGLWYDMGLGKTKIATDTLRILTSRKDIERALVVVPPFLIGVWLRELKKHSFDGELRVQGLSTLEGDALRVETRHRIYRNEPRDERSVGTRLAEAHPDVVYTPLGEGYSDKVYAEEQAYVEAFAAGDSDEMRRARARMRNAAKKDGKTLPRNTPRWYAPTTYAYAEDVNVLVMSYDVMSADVDILREEVSYDMLIFDEVHYLRSPNSSRSKAARKLATRAPRILALSGTPMLGNAWHKYTWLHLMHPSFAPGHWLYRKRFTRTKKLTGTNRRMELGFKNLDLLAEFDELLADTVRVEDCDDLDLPALNIVDTAYTVPKELKDAYNDIVVGWETDTEHYDAPVLVQQGMDRINKLMQILSGFILPSREHFTKVCEMCPHLLACADAGTLPHTPACHVYPDPPDEVVDAYHYAHQPKLDLLTDLLLSITAEDRNKVIIWCTYNEELNMVEDRLEKLKIEYVRVDGSVSDTVSRQDLFEHDDACKVYLSNIAICEGFTLNAANYTIYYGLTYNQAYYLQSLKRNHRIGQGRPVTVYRLYAEGTVHEYILKALTQKARINDVVAGLASCVGCDRRDRCLDAGVEFKSDDCIYSDAPSRVITRPKLLV
mgnify:CR=1 FL=1